MLSLSLDLAGAFPPQGRGPRPAEARPDGAGHGVCFGRRPGGETVSHRACGVFADGCGGGVPDGVPPHSPPGHPWGHRQAGARPHAPTQPLLAPVAVSARLCSRGRLAAIAAKTRRSPCELSRLRQGPGLARAAVTPGSHQAPGSATWAPIPAMPPPAPDRPLPRSASPRSVSCRAARPCE